MLDYRMYKCVECVVFFLSEDDFTNKKRGLPHLAHTLE
jgi:hypothetical protein